jgi:hypothetical protein
MSGTVSATRRISDGPGGRSEWRVSRRYPRDNWADLTFYATLGDRIGRTAIVGAERWPSEALMFVGADVRRAPVECFAGAAAETAPPARG